MSLTCHVILYLAVGDNGSLVAVARAWNGIAVSFQGGLKTFLLWSPYVIGHTIIFLPCDFYLLSFFLFFFPRLISAAADWMSAILPHMV